MAGLYCDITLLASVGKETATNTISRQAILYSSSGLMFSAQTKVLLHIRHAFKHRQHVQKCTDWRKKRLFRMCITLITKKRFHSVCILFSFCVSHHFFVKKEPRQELGRSRRVILLPRTAHKHSWPPGNTKIIHEADGCMPTKASLRGDFMLLSVTFMSVSLGMWSLKSSTELTKKGMWQDNTCRHHDRKKEMHLLLYLFKNQDCLFSLSVTDWFIHRQSLQKHRCLL